MSDLLCIDGSYLAHSAYWGFPGNEDDHQVDGFRISVLRLVKEFKPEYIALTFDSPTLIRREAYPEYKADRDPEVSTSELVRPILEDLELRGIPYLRVEGYEADDLLATLARRAASRGTSVRVVGNDLDLVQTLAHPYVRQVVKKEGEYLERTRGDAEQKIGVSVAQYPDLIGLTGSAKDNVPRISLEVSEGGRTITRKITAPKAVELIRRFGGLEGIYEHITYLPAKTGAVLRSGKDQAFFFRDLVRLREDVEISVDPALLRVSDWDLS